MFGLVSLLRQFYLSCLLRLHNQERSLFDSLLRMKVYPCYSQSSVGLFLETHLMVWKVPSSVLLNQVLFLKLTSLGLNFRFKLKIQSCLRSWRGKWREKYSQKIILASTRTADFYLRLILTFLLKAGLKKGSIAGGRQWLGQRRSSFWTRRHQFFLRL